MSDTPETYTDLVEELKTLRLRVIELDEQVSLLQESTDKAIVGVDLKGNCTFCNRTGLQIFGYENSQNLLGKPVVSLIYNTPVNGTSNTKEPQLFMTEESVYPKEGMFQRADGTTFPAEFWCHPVRRDSSINGWLVVIGDLTERKKTEENRLLASKLDSLGLVASGIAHYFNNVLTPILGNISLIKSHLTPADRSHHWLNEVEAATMLMKDITQQFLSSAQSNFRTKKPTAIGDLIKASAHLAVAGSNVRCHFVLPDNLWPVEVDEGQMSQVIQTFVINARQAMPHGGAIKFRGDNCSTDRETAEHAFSIPGRTFVQITITDQGVGIPKDYLPKIFDPYFTTKESCRGLGLATALAIIKNHGGQISVESELGIGTTFSIILPACPDVKVFKKKKDALLKSDEEARLWPGKGKILVMDDEATIRALLAELLWKCGYTFDVASDGAEAITLYRQAKDSNQAVAAVILDLTIPDGMGGQETIKKLRELDPKVKAIVSSGYSDDPVMVNFRAYGFNGKLIKPFKLADVSEVVQKVICGSLINRCTK